MNAVSFKDLPEESSLLMTMGWCIKWMWILGAPLTDSAVLSWDLLSSCLLFPHSDTAEKMLDHGLSRSIRKDYSEVDFFFFFKDISIFRLGKASVVT